MSSLFDIVDMRSKRKNRWFLKSKDYPISYRLVILYSLYKNKTNFTKDEFQKSTGDAFFYIEHCNDLNDPKQSFKFQSGCFSFYQFRDHKEKLGIILVDHMDGIWPLVFYDSEDTTLDNKDIDSKKYRLSALKYTMKDIFMNYDKLYEILQTAANWNENIQTNILSLIPEKQV